MVRQKSNVSCPLPHVSASLTTGGEWAGHIIHGLLVTFLPQTLSLQLSQMNYDLKLFMPRLISSATAQLSPHFQEVPLCLYSKKIVQRNPNIVRTGHSRVHRSLRRLNVERLHSQKRSLIGCLCDFRHHHCLRVLLDFPRAS